MKTSERIIIAAAIFIFDLVVFFLPVAAIIIAYVLIVKPPWFPQWVERVYTPAEET